MRSSRRGMTLIEVMVAMVILMGAMLSMGRFVSQFAHATSIQSLRSTANEIAVERLEAVKAQNDYAALDSMAITETSITGYSGFTRRTYISHVGGASTDNNDYKIVTVVVSALNLSPSVKKTTMISGF